MLSDRPLSSSKADRARFVDRSEAVTQWRHQLDLGANLLVSGPRGAGKTSTVNQILAGKNVHRVGLVDDLKSLATDLRAFETLGTPLEAALADQLARLEVTVIWLDDPVPGPLPSQFAALRDVWWAASIPWVVTVETGDHTEWLRRPADSFFEHVRLGPLADDDAAELLRHRAEDLAGPFDSHLRDLAQDIVTVTDRMPGALIRAARAALASGDPRGWIEQATRQDQAAQQLSETHQQILAWLRTHGPTSASDPEILQAVGVTRGRVAQLLTDLADQDLVTSARDGRHVLYQTTEG